MIRDAKSNLKSTNANLATQKLAPNLKTAMRLIGLGEHHKLAHYDYTCALAAGKNLDMRGMYAHIQCSSQWC